MDKSNYTDLAFSVQIHNWKQEVMKGALQRIEGITSEFQKAVLRSNYEDLADWLKKTVDNI